MAAALTELGFEVELLTNADLVSMEDGINRLGTKLSVSPLSTGFFFYAGHGVQSNGVNYLIPSDAHISGEAYLKNRALATQVALDTFQGAKNALNVVVFDACRDNPFGWGRSGNRGLSVVGMQPAGSIIVYATSAGGVAQDGMGRNGVFTAELLKNIRVPGVEIKEVFNKTGAAVLAATSGKQIPAVYNQFFGNVYLAGAINSTNISGPINESNISPRIIMPSLFDMVAVPGGSFKMGSITGTPDEQPIHTVTVGDFLIGKYEVTQAQYQAVMGNNPSEFTGDTNNPVDNVCWYDALVFCNRLSTLEGRTPVYTINGSTDIDSWGKIPSWGGDIAWDTTVMNIKANGYRLPTEAEWEYAARGGPYTHGYIYAGSDNISTVAWFGGGDKYTTNAVGQKVPNELGLYDMTGNVLEWCWDWYGPYSLSSITNPIGPFSGSQRVMRGGGWHLPAKYCRITSRSKFVANATRSEATGFNYGAGFRVACSSKE